MSARATAVHHALAATCIGAVTAACPPVEPPVHELELEPAFKLSCGRFPTDVCIACVDAVLVSAVDLEGSNLVAPTCHNVSGRWEFLSDLAQPRTESLLLLDEVPVDRLAIIEVWGYRHQIGTTADGGVDAGAVCAPPDDQVWVDCTDRSTQDLMLWGRSDPTNLSADAGQRQVVVWFECRQDCDCKDIGRVATCPIDMPTTACVSSHNSGCPKECDSDENCYTEPRPCDGGICQVSALRCDEDGGICDPSHESEGTLKPFCARCTSSSECEHSLCVGRTGADGGYCSRSCPEKACPQGAKCAPVDQASGYQVLE